MSSEDIDPFAQSTAVSKSATRITNDPREKAKKQIIECFRGYDDDKVKHRAGACWLYIKVWLNFFTYGFYPDELQWRVNLTFLIFRDFTFSFKLANMIPSPIYKNLYSNK